MVYFSKSINGNYYFVYVSIIEHNIDVFEARFFYVWNISPKVRTLRTLLMIIEGKTALQYWKIIWFYQLG